MRKGLRIDFHSRHPSLWTQEELRAGFTGEDLWATTLLLNQGTFDPRTSPYQVPWQFHRGYVVLLDTGEGEPECRDFKAPNAEMALRWARVQWCSLAIVTILEEIREYRPVWSRDDAEEVEACS